MTRKIQLRDIAHAIGVSAASVSLALRDDPRISEPTRKRVQGKAQEMGYVGVRRRTAVEPLWRFGFVHCDPQASAALYQCEPVLRMIMRDGFQMHARFEVLSIDAELQATGSRQLLVDFARHLQGVLLFGRVHAPILTLLHQMGVPAVVIGESDVSYAQAVEMKMQRVTDDPMRAGIMAGEYLLARGRRRIGFVTGLREPGLYYDQWHRGLVYAHAQAGVPLDDRRVLWHERGNKLTGRIGQLLEPDVRPDAMVWPDAGFAATLLEGLRRSGLELSDADQVVGGVAHVAVAESIERIPQIMADLTAMTKEAIRRLKIIAKNGADSATTIAVAHAMRNFPEQESLNWS